MPWLTFEELKAKHPRHKYWWCGYENRFLKGPGGRGYYRYIKIDRALGPTGYEYKGTVCYRCRSVRMPFTRPR